MGIASSVPPDTAAAAWTTAGPVGPFLHRLAERTRPEDVAALVVEHCFTDAGARRALFAGIDPDGMLSVRFVIGFEECADVRWPLIQSDVLIVRAALTGAAQLVARADFPALGLDPQVFGAQPPVEGALLPLTAPPLARPRGELMPHCSLFRADLSSRDRCYLDRTPPRDPHVPEWESRIRKLCPECPAFGTLGVILIEREQPVGLRELDSLCLMSQLAGMRIRSLQSIERQERAIDKLRKEREWIDTLLVSAADPIVVTDQGNALVLQNRRAEELLVAEAEDSPGKRRAIGINDIMFSAYLSSLGIDPKRAPRELPLVHPIDGSDLLFEAISMPALNSAGQKTGAVTVLRDITDLQKVTQELMSQVYKAQKAELSVRQERDRLNLIVRNALEPIVVTNPSNEIILANAEGEKLFQEGPTDSQARQRTVTFNDANFSSFLTEFNTDPDTQRQRELRLRDPVTDEVRSYEITSAKIRSDKGQTVGVVSVFHDLTKIRELERRRLEQKFFESEKAAATGRLAASIAHEVNNPLEAIKNSLFIVKTRIGVNDAVDKFLEVAQRESERVSNIMKQFLGFYRPAATMLPVDASSVLEFELRLLEKQLEKKDIRVVRQLAQVPKVIGNEDQLKQVFLNLILNAIEAMAQGGVLTVATRFDREPTALSALAPSVRVTVADTGPGVPADVIPSLFEPFFTTKSEKGTGLGLWVSHGIVKSHKGDIKVETEIGLGTKFHVILPA